MNLETLTVLPNAGTCNNFLTPGIACCPGWDIQKSGRKAAARYSEYRSITWHKLGGTGTHLGELPVFCAVWFVD